MLLRRLPVVAVDRRHAHLHTGLIYFIRPGRTRFRPAGERIRSPSCPGRTGEERAMIPGYLSGALRDRPLIGGYKWRARTYPTAVAAITRAEAEHGPPVPTCVCGGRVIYTSEKTHGVCLACGQPPLLPSGRVDDR
jgi:hypothetical protein